MADFASARSCTGFCVCRGGAPSACVLLWMRAVNTQDPNARGESWAEALMLSAADAPLALCTEQGELASATPAAFALLLRLGIVDRVPAPLPRPLWGSLERAGIGDAIAFRALGADEALLDCARYPVSDGGFLLLMREVSDGRRSHVRDRQSPGAPFASTGRLIASVAHDVRSSVASIVYGADFLEERGASIAEHTMRETIQDICDASRRLSLTVDALLDYARLGPAILVPVSLRETLCRAQGLLRSYLPDGARRVRLELSREADWLRGNPVVIEQVLVTLLLSALDCSEPGCSVSVSSEAIADEEQRPVPRVLVRVTSRGAGSAERARLLLAAGSDEPGGLALALADARLAIEEHGGSFACEGSDAGACFVASLPRSEGPR